MTTAADVLVVDDVDDNRTMYAEYLRHKGLIVEEASDGEEAITKVRRLEPAVIVMDLSMPIVDGWEATRRIKADNALRASWIIAVTGHGEPHLGDRARNAGVDDIVIKPCTPAALYERIAATGRVRDRRRR